MIGDGFMQRISSLNLNWILGLVGILFHILVNLQLIEILAWNWKE